MDQKQKGELSSYWQRLMARADTILSNQIKEMSKKIVDPAYCLLDSDKRQMFYRQLDLDGARSVRDTIREGGLAGKLWALDTVWGENPCAVFHP